MSAIQLDLVTEQPAETDPLVVGIGASAGGLNALKGLFSAMPGDTGVAFVVVVHLSPEHESRLAELLQPHCRMPVRQVNETLKIEPDHVYVIPPNANLNTIDTHLRLSELEASRRDRATVDHFFRTLAATHDGKAVGIVLTGTGSDGTLGLRRIKERGGLTIAQDPDEAEHDGMPRSAVVSGMVDLVLPLEQIAREIARLSRVHPRLPNSSDVAATEPGSDSAATIVRELEAELEFGRQRLQTLIEDCETSREEMQSSNEELQSANEELRSTMEELETSKEELQSMNEELATLNQENRHRVEELSQLTSDLQNLMAATNIATLFLDRDLRIVRFTPQVTELFNIRHTDRGRPLSDLTHHLGYENLAEDSRRVLARLVPAEREVASTHERWYLTRVLPYRGNEDRIQGVVITFVDITDRKRAEEALRTSEEFHRLAVEAAQVGTWDVDPTSGDCAASSEMARLLGFDGERQMPRRRWMQAVHEEDRPRVQTALAGALEQEGPLELELRVCRPGGDVRWTYWKGGATRRPSDGLLRLHGATIDVTARKQAEQELVEAKRDLERRVLERTAELESRNERLRRLATELTRAEQRERDRVSNLLHDGLQQLLVAASLQLELVQTPEPGHLASAKRRLSEAVTALRTLSYELTPPRWQEGDLAEALEWLAEWFGQNHAHDVRLVVEEALPPLGADAKLLLYSVVRELLLNGVKHSGTTESNLTVGRSDRGDVRVVVRDGGRGFDPEAIFSKAGDDEAGRGLFSIGERLDAMGGCLEVQSTPGKGASFVVELPAST